MSARSFEYAGGRIVIIEVGIDIASIVEIASDPICLGHQRLR
jgi:hypothetical protein